MSALNPSIGELDRLPAELRNRVYELAADNSNEEVKVVDPCRPHCALALVSKQVSSESIGIIRDFYKKPCQHHRFTFEVPAKWIRITGEDTIKNFNGINAPQMKSHDLSLNPVTYRFLTGHLGRDVPLAIMVKLQLPSGSRLKFYGESEQRTRGEYWMTMDLYDLEEKLMEGNGLTEARDWLKPEDVDGIIACIVSSMKIEPSTLTGGR